jgi:hypothetical protein
VSDDSAWTVEVSDGLPFTALADAFEFQLDRYVVGERFACCRDSARGIFGVAGNLKVALGIRSQIPIK